jgi:hypothetical protein
MDLGVKLGANVNCAKLGVRSLPRHHQRPCGYPPWRQ